MVLDGVEQASRVLPYQTGRKTILYKPHSALGGSSVLKQVWKHNTVQKTGMGNCVLPERPHIYRYCAFALILQDLSY